ncbi:MAG: 2-phosphoglycerate kinase [Euryarchaeota archaeon]|nr:2-phosphoglycerate kinase [Euryarchaeota archaeon]
MMFTVKAKKYRLPFSRGILARSITRTGIEIAEAYHIAEEIGDTLEKKGIEEIHSEELMETTYHFLVDKNYKKRAKNYMVWRKFRKLGKPIIILIGGGTGIGKSTIGSELGYRLGIRSIIGTDTVREVMRKIVSTDLLPALHASSFKAYNRVESPSSYIDKTIYAFEMQVNYVSVGAEAVISRAIHEGFNLVVDGIHLVPGYVDVKKKDSKIFHFILHLKDKEEYTNRFYARSYTSKRKAKHYVKELNRILRIQDFIMDKAKEHNVPLIENNSAEESVNFIMNRITKELAKEV